MAGRKVKVTKVEEETRRDQLERGVKQGTVKNTIDKTVDKMGDPVSDKMKELLHKIHPNMDIAAPGVDAFVKSSLMLGFAEVLGASKHLGGKIPGVKKVDPEKYEQLAAYLRGYTGERVGTQSADGMFKVAPVVADLLGNPDLANFLNDEDNGLPQLGEPDPESFTDIESELKRLNEDEDG